METADSSWKGGSIPRAVLGRFQGEISAGEQPGAQCSE